MLLTPCSAPPWNAKQALRLDPSLPSRISNTGRIIAFRNRLIHGYASIAHEVVWGILEANLPTLQKEVATLLRELNPE